jgi:hypothetical protein
LKSDVEKAAPAMALPFLVSTEVNGSLVCRPRNNLQYWLDLTQKIPALKLLDGHVVF